MTAPRDELAALLARVEAATGASEELDRAVWYKLVLDPELDKPGDGYLKLIGQRPWACTASIDAALALVERVLPGWGWVVGSQPRAWLFSPSDGPECEVEADAATPPLAIVKALLTALLQSEAGQGDGAGENLVHHHG